MRKGKGKSGEWGGDALCWSSFLPHPCVVSLLSLVWTVVTILASAVLQGVPELLNNCVYPLA